MAEIETTEEKLKFLFDRYSTYVVENALRGGEVFPMAPIVYQIANLVREQGEEGRKKLRVMLVVGPQGVDVSAVCATRALAELNDGPSLKVVLAMVDKMWPLVESPNRSDLGISELYLHIRKMVADAYEKSLIDDEVINYVVTSIEKTTDWRAFQSIMDSAALFQDERVKNALLQLVSNAPMQQMSTPGVDWDKRAAAVYALRKFPGMQPLMISLLEHPQRKMADKAAEALVQILELIPGNNAGTYEEWKTWAEPRVPLELQPAYPKGIKSIFTKDPELTHSQNIFWAECRRRYESDQYSRRRY